MPVKGAHSLTTIAEIAARAGCSERRVKYLIDRGFIAGARKQHPPRHKPSRRRPHPQANSMPADTLLRVSVVSQFLDAGSTLDMAALGLLLRGKLCPDAKWTRRALHAYWRLQEDTGDKRRTPLVRLRDVRGALKRYPVPMHSGMPAVWRGLPEVSLPALHQALDDATAADLTCAYHEARKVIRQERAAIEQAFGITLYRFGRTPSTSALRDMMLGDFPYGGDVKPAYLLVPLFATACLLLTARQQPLDREKLMRLAMVLGQHALAEHLALPA